MHVGIANPRSLGKCSRHFRRMHNPQFYVSGKRPMAGMHNEGRHDYEDNIPLWPGDKWMFVLNSHFMAEEYNRRIFMIFWYICDLKYRNYTDFVFDNKTHIIACWWPFCHAITSTKCPRALGTLTWPWNVYPSNSAFFNYFPSNQCCSLATIMSYQRMNEKLSNDICCYATTP